MLLFAPPAASRAATLSIRITDEAGRPLPCRVHLADESGKPQRPAGLPFFHDHFACPGEARIELPDGRYNFTIERGPEYESHTGAVDVDSGQRSIAATLRRIADLAGAGWYSGDLHVHRPPEDMELILRAEDLHVAPVITWWNNRNLWRDRPIPARPLVNFDRNRFYCLMAGEDEREGGALLFFQLGRPLEIADSTPEYPSSLKFVREARAQKEGAWIDIEKPFWWDVPLWLSSGEIDSIGIANNHMCRATMYETEAWGKPRDTDRLPAPRGNGYWSQEIYYHVLNAGLRIPPSAGSASGVLPNPVGYNRVYVHVPGPFTYEKWWEGLRAGLSFVTNGPLLVATANSQLPGHVFSADAGPLDLTLDVSLAGRDDLPTIEVVQNGRVVEILPRTDTRIATTIRFQASGWFLVRAIADEQRTFRFASTAPWYVEIGPEKRRISRTSTRFFLDWVDERIARLPRKLSNADQLQEVLSEHTRAREFWEKRLTAANAD